MSISRNYALKSISKYLEFLLEISGNPANTSYIYKVKGKVPPRKFSIMKICLKKPPYACSLPRGQGPAAQPAGFHVLCLENPASEDGPQPCSRRCPVLVSRPPFSSLLLLTRTRSPFCSHFRCCLLMIKAAQITCVSVFPK